MYYRAECAHSWYYLGNKMINAYRSSKTVKFTNLKELFYHINTAQFLFHINVLVLSVAMVNINPVRVKD